MSVDSANSLPLDQAAKYLLEECRMVLPGIQALFGFQLVAIFNDAFKVLAESDQYLHIIAIILVAMAIGFIMTPAALHRQTSPHQVTHRFIDISTRLLLLSMFPLATAIGIELYIVSSFVLPYRAAAWAISLAIMMFYLLLWFVLPWCVRRISRKNAISESTRLISTGRRS